MGERWSFTFPSAPSVFHLGCVAWRWAGPTRAPSGEYIFTLCLWCFLCLLLWVFKGNSSLKNEITSFLKGKISSASMASCSSMEGRVRLDNGELRRGQFWVWHRNAVLWPRQGQIHLWLWWLDWWRELRRQTEFSLRANVGMRTAGVASVCLVNETSVSVQKSHGHIHTSSL